MTEQSTATPTTLVELEVEWTLNRYAFTDTQWRRLWRRLADRTQHPREPVVLYRGARPEGKRGMSWSTSQADASRYAELNVEGEARVYRATVEPDAILGIINDEHIVDPRKLPRRLTDITDKAEPSRHAQRLEQGKDVERLRQRRADGRRWQDDYATAFASRRGNGRTLLANAVAAHREADRRARRR